MDKRTPRRIWTVGASSRIAIEMQRRWARPESSFVLAGRDRRKLERVAADLLCRGAQSAVCRDLTPPAIDGQEFDLLLIAIGSLSDQDKWKDSPEYRRAEWELNTSMVFDWVEWGAANIERCGGGRLAVVSSVASDRAKKSNYGYGAAKSALDFYMEGVSHRLSASGGVVTVLKPGPTDTPMTLGVANRSLADPRLVAEDLVKAVERGVPRAYSPRKWRLIMKVIKLCPRWLWNRTSL